MNACRRSSSLNITSRPKSVTSVEHLPDPVQIVTEVGCRRMERLRRQPTRQALPVRRKNVTLRIFHASLGNRSRSMVTPLDE